MKGLFYKTAVLLLACLYTATAFAQSWQWGKRGGSNFDETGAGGSSWENTIDMATDANGNIYTLNIIYAGTSSDVDGHPVLKRGFDDILISSYSCKGVFRWSKTIGTTGIGDQAVALKTDDLGGVYVLGTFISQTFSTPRPLYVHTDSIRVPDNRSVFLAKYDTSGNYKWIRTPEPDTLSGVLSRTPSVFRSWAVDMDLDGSGNVSVLLYASPGAFANGAYVVSGPGMSYHMLRYDANGSFVKGYKMNMSCPPGNQAYARMKIRLDRQKNKWYLAGGLYKGFTGEDSLTLGGTFLNNSAFLSRFDDAGNMEWLKTNAGGTFKNTTIGGRPVIDKYSNLYITGGGGPGDVFNGYTFTNPLSSVNRSSAFIMKIDSSGKTAWAKNSGNVNSLNGDGIALSGNVVGIKGGYVGRLDWGVYSFNWLPAPSYANFFVRFNSMTGAIFGADSLGAKMEINVLAPGTLAADKLGNFNIGGGFWSENDLHVGPSTLVSAGGKADFFVARHGRSNCDCTAPPLASFNTSVPAGSLTAKFTFTGTTAADSVVWYFGDSTETATTDPSHTYKTKGSYTACAVVYNSCGSDVYCKTVEVGTTGISESGLARVRIYPNPAQDQLSVEGAVLGSELRLFDLMGQEVFATMANGNNNLRISLNGFAPGIYVFQYQDPQGNRFTEKICKQ